MNTRGELLRFPSFLGEALDIFDELALPSGCRLKSRLKAKKPLTKAQKMGKKSKKNLH